MPLVWNSRWRNLGAPPAAAGNVIVFGDGPSLETCAADGSGATTIDSAGWATARLNPAGNIVAGSIGPALTSHLYTIHMDGTAKTLITGVSGNQENHSVPGWTSDGSKIICAYDDGTNGGIEVIHADNSGFTDLPVAASGSPLAPQNTFTGGGASPYVVFQTATGFIYLGRDATSGDPNICTCGPTGSGAAAILTDPGITFSYFLLDVFADGLHALVNQQNISTSENKLLKIDLSGSIISTLADDSGSTGAYYYLGNTIMGCAALNPGDETQVLAVGGSSGLKLVLWSGGTPAHFPSPSGLSAVIVDW